MPLGMSFLNGMNIDAIEREVEISNILSIANNPIVMERLNEEARENILRFATAYGELASIGLLNSKDKALSIIVSYMNGELSYEDLKESAKEK